MKNFLIAFIVFLVWSFFGLWLYSWLQPEDEIAVNNTVKIDEASDTITKTDTELPLNTELPTEAGLDKDSLLLSEKIIDKEGHQGLKAVNEAGDIVLLFPKGITIYKNTDEISIPQEVIDFKYKINTYLVEHPDKELHISALYSATENFETPNFGIKRGNKLKEILTDVGIPSERIVIKPTIKEIDFSAANTYENGFSFSFKPLDEDRIESVRFRIPESKIVYPRFSNTGIMVNENLRNLLDEVKQIVAANPDTEIEVIGHTDNVGNGNDNYYLGLEYARQVRWYLVKKGNLDRKKIRAISKGEEDPIDTNQTVRGRNANRRIEIVFN
ncbi:MAG: OmpA family protein [Flavobacteriales bacterium]|jgi:OOP family OmpA-OmpF porin|uniref:OmpA family protein n=1 Tax=Candidatus Ulvibacter alkanivorans TaxID=2267620 RepID=UPI000DF32A5F|nr:OmpA family protein [Candidatus Ulvibacter alkanivorans]MCH2488994.1 OmpA family protein [Flavobacteriales bacterium]